MPGLLSNVFGEESGGADQTGQQTQEYDASGDTGIDLSPSVGISNHVEGSYQHLDGSTTDWSSDSEVTVTVDVSAVLDVAGLADQTTITEN